MLGRVGLVDGRRHGREMRYAVEPERLWCGGGPSSRAASEPWPAASTSRCVATVPTAGLVRYQSCSDAILAPSAMAWSLSHVTLGSTERIPANVPNPQSVPAMTFSLPTARA